MEQPRGVRHSARMSAFGTKRTCRHVCACPLSGAKQTSAADRLEIAIYEMHLAERSSAWDTWIFLTFHGCHSLTHEITHNRSDALLRRAKWKRAGSSFPIATMTVGTRAELSLLIREIVERLQHHDLELQDRIVGLAALLLRSSGFVSVTLSMSARKSSHRTIFLIVSSGSPLALIASSLRSTSKKPVCPMTRSFHPPLAHCNHRVRFAATWREEFFEVPFTDFTAARGPHANPSFDGQTGYRGGAARVR